MTKEKLNSNVDEDLVELVQEWKPYLKIAKEMNQEVCIGIDNKNTYLNLLKEATTEKSCIERLIQEKEAHWVGKDHGRIDGLKFAQDAPFSALRFIVKIWQDQIYEALKKSTLVQAPTSRNCGYAFYIDSYFEEEVFFSYLAMDWRTEELNEYIPYWLSGVKDFWNLIKNKI
jgi:hypothetical protein